MMKVYYAHPCFTEKQREFKKMFLEKLSVALSHKNDITIVDPFEYAPNIEGDTETKLKMAESIMRECIKLLEECDGVIAFVDDNDTGTAFEAGYAHAVNKPVILISQDSCSTANAMLIGTAKIMIDNVLEEGQIKKLVNYLKWLCGTLRQFSTN
ncbi:MAG: nucleoside 2-deoxyribosyltransferase [Proteobacteria bacterium]|nr:nucleoside 2-deoxyribosyltransferase [Pseudomonadota bacterium]